MFNSNKEAEILGENSPVIAMRQALCWALYMDYPIPTQIHEEGTITTPLAGEETETQQVLVTR